MLISVWHFMISILTLITTQVIVYGDKGDAVYRRWELIMWKCSLIDSWISRWSGKCDVIQLKCVLKSNADEISCRCHHHHHEYQPYLIHTHSQRKKFPKTRSILSVNLFSFASYLDIVSMAIFTIRFVWMTLSHFVWVRNSIITTMDHMLYDEIFLCVLNISVDIHRHTISHNDNLWSFQQPKRPIINFVSRRKNLLWQIILRVFFSLFIPNQNICKSTTDRRQRRQWQQQKKWEENTAETNAKHSKKKLSWTKIVKWKAK